MNKTICIRIIRINLTKPNMQLVRVVILFFDVTALIIQFHLSIGRYRTGPLDMQQRMKNKWTIKFHKIHILFYFNSKFSFFFFFPLYQTFNYMQILTHTQSPFQHPHLNVIDKSKAWLLAFQEFYKIYLTLQK